MCTYYMQLTLEWLLTGVICEADHLPSHLMAFWRRELRGKIEEPTFTFFICLSSQVSDLTGKTKVALLNCSVTLFC
jgi:hypothetical protein